MEKSKYSWIITVDKVFNPKFDEKSHVGTIGPYNGWEREEIDNCKNVQKFRMYDDDGEHYYSGIMAYADKKYIGGECDFAPLDGFGMPNAGCVRIDYYNVKTKAWETL